MIMSLRTMSLYNNRNRTQYCTTLYTVEYHEYNRKLLTLGLGIRPRGPRILATCNTGTAYSDFSASCRTRSEAFGLSACC